VVPVERRQEVVYVCSYRQEGVLVAVVDGMLLPHLWQQMLSDARWRSLSPFDGVFPSRARPLPLAVVGASDAFVSLWVLAFAVALPANAVVAISVSLCVLCILRALFCMQVDAHVLPICVVCVFACSTFRFDNFNKSYRTERLVLL